MAAAKPTLSVDELAVLELLLEGYGNQAIARRLTIGLRTVELRRQRLMKKLGAKGAVQLGMLAERYLAAERGQVSGVREQGEDQLNRVEPLPASVLRGEPLKPHEARF